MSKAQILHQITLGQVVRPVDRNQLCKTSLLRHADQMLHEGHAQAAVVSIVSDGYRALAAPPIGLSRASADADLARMATVVDYRNESHCLQIVDIHQLVRQRFAGLLEIARKAEAPGLGRHTHDEIRCKLAAFRTDWPHQYTCTVTHRIDPVAIL